MTKILTVKEIEERLRRMSITMKLTNANRVEVGRTFVANRVEVGRPNVQQMASVEKSEIIGVGPTPIFTFGVGQGEHISVCELKWDSRQHAYFLSRNE